MNATRKTHAALSLALLLLVTACRDQPPSDATGVRAAGERHIVQAGSWNGVSWKLLVQEMGGEQTCQSLILQPPPYEFKEGPDGGSAAMWASGEPPSCGPIASFQLSSDPIVEYYFRQLATDRYHFIAGGSAPEVKRVIFKLDDGSESTVSTVQNTFILLFPRERRITEILGVAEKGDVLARCSIRTNPAGFEALECGGYRLQGSVPAGGPSA